VGTWHFVVHLAFILVGSLPFFWCAPGILGATWNIGGHSAIFLVGTWRLVTSWHLVGHPAFFFLGTLSFGGHSLCLMVGIQCYFGGHPAFLLVGMGRFCGHLASCWESSIYFAEHMPFLWPPGILVGSRCLFAGHVAFWWEPSVSSGGHPAFNLVCTLRSGGHLASLWATSISLLGMS